jgi:hypothetical protein
MLTKQNKEYLDLCIHNNDLMIFGVYDQKTKYAILHKWGTSKEVKKIITAFKNGAIYSGIPNAENVYVTYEYPEFTESQLIDFLTHPEAFKEFHEAKIA